MQFILALCGFAVALLKIFSGRLPEAKTSKEIESGIFKHIYYRAWQVLFLGRQARDTQAELDADPDSLRRDDGYKRKPY